MTTPPWSEPKATALLVLDDGTVIEGVGVGALGKAAGEVCFNTAMTGYEEILTDPSYAGQIVTFTFPHIGNVGTNEEDIETVNAAASSGVTGCVLKTDVTEPANWRATRRFDQWLKARGIVGIAGVDTRALTARIREKGMPNGIVVNAPDGVFDIAALKSEAAALPKMAGLDLVPGVTTGQSFSWDETTWRLGTGYGHRDGASALSRRRHRLRHQAQHSAAPRRPGLRGHGAAGDGERGGRAFEASPTACSSQTAPATRRRPANIRCRRSRPWWTSGVPTFGICLGHQMLGLALGGETAKMRQGPSRRQPSGEGFHDRQGRDRLDEPRLRARQGQACPRMSRRPTSRSSTARTAASA